PILLGVLTRLAAGRGGDAGKSGKFVELQVLEVAIQLALRQQLLVVSGRLDPAAVQQKDAIATANGREAVRQEDDRSSGQNASKRVIQQGLGVVVQSDRRLLDDQKGGVPQNGPRQGDPKLLADGQGMAHLPNRRLV